MQQEDQVGERRPLHQVEDVVSPDPDVVGSGVDDGGAPGVHCKWLDYYVRAEARGRVVTVTAP